MRRSTSMPASRAHARPARSSEERAIVAPEPDRPGLLFGHKAPAARAVLWQPEKLIPRTHGMHSAVGHSLPHSPPTVVVAQQHIRLSERELFASWELPLDYGGQQQSIASDSIGHFASEGEENSSALDGDAREWGLAQSLAAWWHEAETDFERNKARDEQQPEPGLAPALALVESEPERDSARDKFPAFLAVTRWRARRRGHRMRRGMR